ncbi:MAG TPA: type II toxin-antitoxin system VapC family toxin [Terriglobales bacterium]|nr:type II toxin-antitoxin system VapC family toxin [Terriglobales bacterium]
MRIGTRCDEAALDTHIWLWRELEPSRMRGSIARALANPNNELWLSPVSAWELLLLVERGRIELDRTVAEWVNLSMANEGYRTAPLTVEVALAAAQVQLEHCDPADRLLAATARSYDLVLVTTDERLAGGRGYARLRWRGESGAE